MPLRLGARSRASDSSAARTKPGPQEQVLGRVAGDRELGEEDEVGAGAPCLRDRLQDPLAVAVEVADGRC